MSSEVEGTFDSGPLVESRRRRTRIYSIIRGMIEIVVGTFSIIGYVYWIIYLFSDYTGGGDTVMLLVNTLIFLPLYAVMLYLGIYSFKKPSAYLRLNMGIGIFSIGWVLVDVIIWGIHTAIHEYTFFTKPSYMACHFLHIFWALTPGLAILLLTLAIRNRIRELANV